MIKKVRKIPIYMNRLETLINRLDDDPFKQNLERELAKMAAGFRGEESLNYFLDMLPHKKDCHILHDLRILHESTYFQIDTLLINPAYCLIIEVKNISGTLFFDHIFQQLLRTTNGVEESFQDPISQVGRQKLQLENWLIKHKFPPVPVETLIVMTHSQSILKTNDITKRIPNKVIHSTQLLNRIQQLNRKYKNTLVSKDMNKITKRLIKEHTPREIDIFERFQINKERITKGIQCSKCLAFGMIKGHGTWKCPKCDFTSKDAHINALKDYCLLFNSSITNKQVRDFLKLSSTSIASKLLVSMNLPYTGNFKDRKYSLQSILDYE